MSEIIFTPTAGEFGPIGYREETDSDIESQQPAAEDATTERQSPDAALLERFKQEGAAFQAMIQNESIKFIDNSYL